MIRIMIRNIEKKRYLRVAWALWMVTWSSVASRLGRPRSKYLISNSRNGLISWDENEEMTDALYRLNTESNSNSNRINHLILDEFPNNSSHFITCIHSFIRYNIKFILLINKYNLTRIEGWMRVRINIEVKSLPDWPSISTMGLATLIFWNSISLPLFLTPLSLPQSATMMMMMMMITIMLWPISD